MNFLDFEKPIAELEAKIEELRYVSDDSELNINDEIARLKQKSLTQTKTIFSSLSAWQIAQISRHPMRPYTLDYITRMLDSFKELHGDRHYRDDPAIICGIGRLGRHPVALIGHQKGRDTQERIYRNYGMPRPEGYRKASRIMKLAERFQLPVLTLIDTPGAYPGIDAEERGQSVAIAENLLLMSELKTPIISIIIGEGGSGGALAIGVSDQLYMLQYSIYSVISPEGCASILWRNTDKAKEAAETMGITAQRLKDLGLIDGIIMEPPGGAHRDFDAMAVAIRETLGKRLDLLCAQTIDKTLQKRQERLRHFGQIQSI